MASPWLKIGEAVDDAGRTHSFAGQASDAMDASAVQTSSLRFRWMDSGVVAAEIVRCGEDLPLGGLHDFIRHVEHAAVAMRPASWNSVRWPKWS
jgi:hypothetical protein